MSKWFGEIASETNSEFDNFIQAANDMPIGQHQTFIDQHTSPMGNARWQQCVHPPDGVVLGMGNANVHLGLGWGLLALDCRAALKAGSDYGCAAKTTGLVLGWKRVTAPQGEQEVRDETMRAGHRSPRW